MTGSIISVLLLSYGSVSKETKLFFNSKETATGMSSESKAVGALSVSM